MFNPASFECDSIVMRTAPPLHYVDTENVELSSSAEQVFEIIIFAKSYRYMFSSRQISLDNNYLYMLLKRKKHSYY